jgi:large subunit ribosomal protein L7/L12
MANVQEILDSIAGMTVLELVELKKAFEERFDVKAAAPAAAVMMAPAAGAAAAPAVEEQDEFDLMLLEAGEKKINVIKEVRELTKLGLKEAKDLVDGAPSKILEKVSKEDGQKALAKLTDAGAKAELK